MPHDHTVLRAAFGRIAGLWRGRSGAACTVLCVLDRDSWTARTDNVVVADTGRRRLTWVPRDLWCEVARDRINAAFAHGGHALLQAGLRELGVPVASSVVLFRRAVERAVRDLRITVPVETTRRYWYPLAPTSPIQDGAKLVTFEAPEAELTGERIHQWIGARRSADPSPPRLPDLDRIARQQVFLRRLLQEQFDFRQVVADPSLVSVSDESALSRLAAVRPDWAMRTLDRVAPATMENRKVLVLRRSLPRLVPRGGR